MQARSLVFEVPDQIRGQGRLVRTSDGDWFDPPLAVALNWNRAAPTPSHHAIPVEGANFDSVGWRYEQDGAVEGGATIYGQWLGDRIRVHHQTQEPPAPPAPRHRLRDRLCVVASRWTRPQLDGVHAHLWSRAEKWGIYGTGQSSDEQAQATVIVELVRVTAEIACWADSQPTGLVVLKPCLAPIGVDDHSTVRRPTSTPPTRASRS